MRLKRHMVLIRLFFQWKIQKLMKAKSIYISFDRHIAGQQKLKGIQGKEVGISKSF